MRLTNLRKLLKILLLIKIIKVADNRRMSFNHLINFFFYKKI